MKDYIDFLIFAFTDPSVSRIVYISLASVAVLLALEILYYSHARRYDETRPNHFMDRELAPRAPDVSVGGEELGAAVAGAADAGAVAGRAVRARLESAREPQPVGVRAKGVRL